MQVFRNGEWIEEAYVSPEHWPLPPPGKAFWRLPIIRHVRWFVLAQRVSAWNGMWLSLGRIPTGYDSRVLDAIWRGKV